MTGAARPVPVREPSPSRVKKEDGLVFIIDSSLPRFVCIGSPAGAGGEATHRFCFAAQPAARSHERAVVAKLAFRFHPLLGNSRRKVADYFEKSFAVGEKPRSNGSCLEAKERLARGPVLRFPVEISQPGGGPIARFAVKSEGRQVRAVRRKRDDIKNAVASEPGAAHAARPARVRPPASSPPTAWRRGRAGAWSAVRRVSRPARTRRCAR